MQFAIRSATLAIVFSCCWGPSYAIQTGQRANPDARQLPAPKDRIDINHATMDQLIKVPGMTRTWAGRIVRFRPYRAKTDLLENGVVTAEVYNRIKDYVIAHRGEY
ncbi:MAG TPA: helix-hairpin-helix domain-containing protein [Terracidiphilus sp.]|nr:helix-hairpin-helix domain-containing protein [Terracidiphilus sp.]